MSAKKKCLILLAATLITPAILALTKAALEKPPAPAIHAAPPNTTAAISEEKYIEENF